MKKWFAEFIGWLVLAKHEKFSLMLMVIKVNFKPI
jgi:hypothetical protein